MLIGMGLQNKEISTNHFILTKDREAPCLFDPSKPDVNSRAKAIGEAVLLNTIK